MTEPTTTPTGTGPEAIPGQDIESDPTKRGVTRVADKVVEKVALAAAREIDHSHDTHSTWTDLTRRGLPRATAVVAGDTTRIHVDIAAPWPVNLTQVTAGVRTHVAERVHTLIGMDVTAVDVTVADVIHPQTTLRRVH